MKDGKSQFSLVFTSNSYQHVSKSHSSHTFTRFLDFLILYFCYVIFKYRFEIKCVFELARTFRYDKRQSQARGHQKFLFLQLIKLPKTFFFASLSNFGGIRRRAKILSVLDCKSFADFNGI